ncbi:hypothetical protein A3SI_03473 [Nitritalea halalkaliphila LW7]|uniref:Uncharacterized protein n=1 Tax=Nitritalea halalkaliphila LW7 TaxID=1189621 RepID=I5C9B5_9BACT|nr:hypothetical protein [Nitritalea halalkaliphila]EIM78417.1 hypothetical protein A3SI_03473 [Nitritalea halalkaliphila LW7]
MKKEYTVPANFNTSDYTSHFARSDVRKGVTEAMHYILDHIITHPQESEKGKETFESRGGVALYTVILREKLGQRAADKALQYLLTNKVIIKLEGANQFKDKAALYGQTRN